MCERIHLPGGHGVAIVCGGHRHHRQCAFCTNEGTHLCDFPIGEKQSGDPITCDVPMCSRCARQVGADRDYCPNHSMHAVRKTVLDPQTGAELKKAGYRYVGAGTCRGCNAPIAWVRTPANKSMPMSILAGGRFISHFANCPNRKAFSRANRIHRERAEGKKPQQTTLF